MAKDAVNPVDAIDEQVRLLLVLYRCPVPFHIVRTRFLGSTVSSESGVSPIEAVKSLWGGDLPRFRSKAALNELMEVLVTSLWNRLARHRERRVPFRLLELDVPPDREGLGQLAVVRREELEGFMEGLFGPKETLDLPHRAYRALEKLSEIRMSLYTLQLSFAGAIEPATPAEIASTLGALRMLTKTAEHEIHEVVLSCTNARRDISSGLTASKTILN
jgi:hypothetical protein